MNKTLLIVILAMLYGTITAQTPIDSLNATPNPFSKRTLVSYTLAYTDTTTALVLNTLGSVVITIYSNLVKTAGSYQDSIILDNFPDGVYVLSIKPKHRPGLTKKLVKSLGSGILENSTLNDMLIYPNPTTGKLSIEFNNNQEIIRLALTNTLGQIAFLMNKGELPKELNLSLLPNGIYYLNAISDSGQKVFKVIKE